MAYSLPFNQVCLFIYAKIEKRTSVLYTDIMTENERQIGETNAY